MLYLIGLCQAFTPCLRNAFGAIVGSRQLSVNRPGGVRIISQIYRQQTAFKERVRAKEEPAGLSGRADFSLFPIRVRKFFQSAPNRFLTQWGSRERGLSWSYSFKGEEVADFCAECSFSLAERGSSALPQPCPPWPPAAGIPPGLIRTTPELLYCAP